jgi:hypothetical protein
MPKMEYNKIKPSVKDKFFVYFCEQISISQLVGKYKQDKRIFYLLAFMLSFMKLFSIIGLVVSIIYIADSKESFDIILASSLTSIAILVYLVYIILIAYMVKRVYENNKNGHTFYKYLWPYPYILEMSSRNIPNTSRV